MGAVEVARCVLPSTHGRQTRNAQVAGRRRAGRASIAQAATKQIPKRRSLKLYYSQAPRGGVMGALLTDSGRVNGTVPGWPIRGPHGLRRGARRHQLAHLRIRQCNSWRRDPPDRTTNDSHEGHQLVLQTELIDLHATKQPQGQLDTPTERSEMHLLAHFVA